MTKRDWLVAGGIALCALVFAACGAASDSGGDDEKAEFEQARLAFAECMREQGVDMPDPQPGQAGIKIGGPDSDFDPGQPGVEEAMAACEDEMPELPADAVSPEQQEEFRDQALAFAQCMRDHGIDMPDPQFEGSGKVRMTMQKGSGPGPDSPLFEQAQEACQGEMPKMAAPKP